MKKTLIAAALLIGAATNATAGGTTTVLYPREACFEIVSQEYSTGGGATSIQILEILCKSEDGRYTGFVASWTSIAGAFGFGRVGIVDKFVYQPYEGNTLEIQ